MDDQELLTLNEIRKSINDSIEIKKYDFSKQTHMMKYIMDCEKLVHEMLGPDFYVDEVIIDRDKKVLSMEICRNVKNDNLRNTTIKGGINI